MRLTLRTLLAWLDDTLPSAEVRQIGKQVAESPFAQELVDKTYRVTRQRRLLVPSTSGPEGTDPNLVSAYLDNELPGDEVAEYEKKCLTSDVNLAEVASVHQILSLIGQKAKVPPEARHRMYRLVKGREAAGTRSARAFPHHAPEPVATQAEEWSAQFPSSRPLVERLGIAALVLSLVAVIVWTAFSTLTRDPNAGVDRLQAAEANRLAAELAAAKEAKAADLATTRGPVSPPPKPAGDATAPPPADVAKAGDAEKAAPPAPIKLVKGDLLALGWNPDKSEWSRLSEAVPLKDGARVLSFAPFWTGFQAGPIQLTLIGNTETSVAGADRRSTLLLGFDHGRAILRGVPDGSVYRLAFAGQNLTIQPAPGSSIGLERLWKLTPGQPDTPPAPLTIHVTEGPASLQVGDTKQVVNGPASLTLSTTGTLAPLPKAATPAWLTSEGPTPAEKQLGERFLKDFSPNGSVLRDLVQALDGDDPDVRRLAVNGLGEVGDAEMVVPVLNNAMTDAGTRRAAADVLRTMLARGGASAKAVRAELGKVFGQEWADDLEKLLIGFTPEEQKREQTYAELVRLLEAPELGTRELAVHALMDLTGRDNLEYDPLKPAAKGLKSWQDLLHRKELLKK